MPLQHKQHRPVIDLLVAMIAVPVLIICALQLEKNMQEKWAENANSRWMVFGLGVGMLLISVIICGYVTHRMGVCLWTGPLEDNSPIPFPHVRIFSNINSIFSKRNVLFSIIVICVFSWMLIHQKHLLHEASKLP